MAYGLSNGHVTDDVISNGFRDIQRRCEAVRSAIVATAWLLVLQAVTVRRYDVKQEFKR